MLNKICEMLDPEIVHRDEPMKDHTTFRIGGPADYLVTPRSQEELSLALKCCRDLHMPVFVMGLGSNILVADQGIRGMVIQIGPCFSQIEVEGETIRAQAGIGLAELTRYAARCGLSGLEFAEGIPGSLGGAIFMNAGAYGGEMSQVVMEVDSLSPTGQEQKIYREDLDFGYRHSVFQHNDCIITAACLRLRPADKLVISQKMQEYAENRRSKQPLGFPSAGSVFKRPSGYFVGPLLEELGLKGYRIGGAEISRKHAGFIVNTGNASANDVLQLIAHIRQVAMQKAGVDLHPEIRVIGEL